MHTYVTILLTISEGVGFRSGSRKKEDEKFIPDIIDM